MGRNGKKDWKECNWRQRKERVSEIYTSLQLLYFFEP